MSNLRLWLDLALACAALAAVADVRVARASDDAGLRGELEALAHRSVFFGHQSVGGNILDGVRALAEREGVPLRIAEVPAATGVPRGTLAHALMPENGDPARKLSSFEAALTGQAGPDVALLKFCYVDFDDPRVDVEALFERYQATLARLEARHPNTVFVRATMPLTTVQGGVKGFVKRLVGRPLDGGAANDRRERFNALVRDAAAGKPLFDIARVESTWPDGRRETFSVGGRQVPALVPVYTEDGGHLTGAGRLRAAREFVKVLAAAAPAAGS